MVSCADCMRVRLQFIDLADHQLDKCWFLVKPSQIVDIKDLQRVIAQTFNLNHDLRIRLLLNDFLLPAWESIDILRENDLLIIKQSEADDAGQAELWQDSKLDDRRDNLDQGEASIDTKHSNGAAEADCFTKKERRKKRRKEKKSRDASSDTESRMVVDGDSIEETERPQKKQKHKKKKCEIKEHSQEDVEEAQNSKVDELHQEISEQHPVTSSSEKSRPVQCKRGRNTGVAESEESSSDEAACKKQRPSTVENEEASTPNITNTTLSNEATETSPKPKRRRRRRKKKTQDESMTNNNIMFNNVQATSTPTEVKPLKFKPKWTPSNSGHGQTPNKINHVHFSSDSETEPKVVTLDPTADNLPAPSDSSISQMKEETKATTGSLLPHLGTEVADTKIAEISCLTVQRVRDQNSQHSFSFGQQQNYCAVPPPVSPDKTHMNHQDDHLPPGPVTIKTIAVPLSYHQRSQFAGVTVYKRQRFKKAASYALTKEEQLQSVLTNKSVILQNGQKNLPGEEKGNSISQHDDPKDKEPSNVSASLPNFDDYPSLHGPPRVGDTIAFKVLELSESYCPELSAYKVGRVLNYNAVSQMLEIEMTENADKNNQNQGKFDLTVEDEDEILTNCSADEKKQLHWTSLVDAKLVK